MRLAIRLKWYRFKDWLRTRQMIERLEEALK